LFKAVFANYPKLIIDVEVITKLYVKFRAANITICDPFY